MRQRLGVIFGKGGVYLLLAVCLVVFGVLSPALVSPSHLLELTVHGASLGIVAMGQTIVMLVGSFDLSVGATMTLINVLGAGMLGGGEQNVIPILILLLGLGALVGFINGIGITKLKIPAFMMTLGMWLVLRGVVLVYTKGGPKGFWPPSIQFLGKGWVGGVFPASTLLWLALTIGGVYLLRKTVWGQYIYAAGGNPRTAFLSGIRVHHVLILAFTLSGLLAAVAGVVLSGYVGWGSFQVGGEPYLLNSLAAAVLGGTTFRGGIGGLSGTFGGAYLLTLIDSVLTMLGVGHAGRLIFTGSVIVVFTGLYEKLTGNAR
jgi:ribose/xylose/arabinose/galactoside ABC-type transport system permease subunit